ncbi:DUF2269 domain-containing protein [Pseudomaricurvus alkylphenolicus]|uniref:DUF2269 family protein n=1 Tax=Pseudomaricurvus alkylphenolicus TaxID=1306991 RepID=UPI00141DBF9F|nr:DUF2269 domain-containing protein [Pseudomaricurvus alkylphenolicus]NIB39301.1 DUF2269 domain-containing protein [Pseudomaricurvus alkylphenolicus]
MDNYLLLKLIHILSAVVVAGTGAGIAFFMLMASRSSNPAAIAVTARHVVLADWIFTAPAVLLQFVTGILLMLKLGYSFTSTWFFWVITLFVFIGVCWAPVIVIQYKLKALADRSLDAGELDPDFKNMMRLWVALGVPAFAAILVIFWLMVFKPFPVL